MSSDLGIVGQWVYSKVHTPLTTFKQTKKTRSLMHAGPRDRTLSAYPEFPLFDLSRANSGVTSAKTRVGNWTGLKGDEPSSVAVMSEWKQHFDTGMDVLMLAARLYLSARGR